MSPHHWNLFAIPYIFECTGQSLGKQRALKSSQSMKCFMLCNLNSPFMHMCITKSKKWENHLFLLPLLLTMVMFMSSTVILFYLFLAVRIISLPFAWLCLCRSRLDSNFLNGTLPETWASAEAFPALHSLQLTSNNITGQYSLYGLSVFQSLF